MTDLETQADTQVSTDGPAGAADAPSMADFETAVAELESIVATLESGDVSLEQALSKFERGVWLTRQCQTTLKNAELRVDQLLGADDGDGVPSAAPFETGDGDDSSNEASS